MALFRGDARVGKYDPVADKFTEYKALTQPGRIRRASVDLEDRVWYGVYDKGVIGWIDPQSGKAVEYLLPHQTNIRRVFIDNTTTPVTFWAGNNHHAAILKIEPRE